MTTIGFLSTAILMAIVNWAFYRVGFKAGVESTKPKPWQPRGR